MSTHAQTRPRAVRRPSLGLTRLDLLRALLVAGVPFVVLYVPDSNGAFVGTAAVLIVAVRFTRIPPGLETAFVLSLALAAWGNPLGLYRASEAFGLGVHALMSAVDGPAIYLALVAFGILPLQRDGRGLAGAFVSVLAISVTIGAGWEVIEWVVDSVWGTTLVGSQGQMAADLLVDTLGGLVGAAAVVVWLRRGGLPRGRHGEVDHEREVVRADVADPAV